MAVLNLTIGRREGGARAEGIGGVFWRLAGRAPQDSAAAERAAEQTLASALSNVDGAGPLLFLVHGYRYDPNDRVGDLKRDPHRVVLRAAAAACRSAPPGWPIALGFTEPGASGLAVAVGWSSLPPPRPWTPGARHPFAWAYGAATDAAMALARIMRVAAQARPDMPLDLFGHSLGARVAFLALRIAADEGWDDRIGRILALGAAEYRDQALRAARRCRPGGPEVVNILSRANDPYDAAVQFLGPRPTLATRARPLGAGGLGRRAPGWIDMQLDHPEMRGWLARNGVAARCAGRFCRHDAFYARPGVAALYRRLLDQRWTGDDLRASGVVEAIEPRWARFAPVRRRNLPTPPMLGTARRARFASARPARG